MGALKAHVDLVDALHYRKDAFCAGLESLGYEIEKRPSDDPQPGDCLVLWNRYQRDEAMAKRYERAGAWVVVTENAPLGPEEKDEHLFSFYLYHHNGAGVWHVGREPRWHPECKPWRRVGEHVLILPQRGMGEVGVRQEQRWLPDILRQLRGLTQRPVKIRLHPGPRPHSEIDWDGVWCCVTWGSAAGLKAIVAGIPVFYTFPKWVGAEAAHFFPADLEFPNYADRAPLLHRLSWAMWSAEEIAQGLPFEFNFHERYRRI